MNILVTLDSNYVNPLCKMLKSLENCHKNESINVFVAHSSLSDMDFARIKRSVPYNNFEIIPIKIDDDLFENAPTCKRISKETYYRIFAPVYLKEDVKKILYIDPDTLIINSLNDFYNTDMRDGLIVGAKHFDGFVDEWNKFRLGIKHSPSYINAGIMLMNVEGMRKCFDAKKIFDYINKNERILFLADQDVINKIYDGKIAIYNENIINLDERCFKRLVNEMGENRAMQYIKETTSIIHYNGKYKPWKENYKGYLDKLYVDDKNVRMIYYKESVKKLNA